MESSCIAHRYTKSTPTSSSLLSSTVIFHMHWCFGHPRPPPPGHTKLWMLGKMISCKFNVEIAAFALWCNIFVNLQFGKPILENILPKVIYCVKRKEKKRTIWMTVKIKLMTKRGSTISSTLTIEARGWNSLLMIFLLFSLQACFMIKDFKANFLGKLI